MIESRDTAYGRVPLPAGHDFGAAVAAWAALIRPDIFRTLALMSAPLPGPPDISPRPPPARSIHAELAALDRPRQHYQWYYSTPEANADMHHCPLGLAGDLCIGPSSIRALRLQVDAGPICLIRSGRSRSLPTRINVYGEARDDTEQPATPHQDSVLRDRSMALSGQQWIQVSGGQTPLPWSHRAGDLAYIPVRRPGEGDQRWKSRKPSSVS